MKIKNISLTNFRQYYGDNQIDLTTNDGKNIILVGGKTGFGKTNFLLSLVWCLYGEDIAKIDEGFKKEIQKDGNYGKFLKSSLNWTALKEGKNSFSVELLISGVELPETRDIKHGQTYQCRLKRKYDLLHAGDELEISIEGAEKVAFNTMEEKVNFINDYIIPLEAAKFVFFDAEKIASWAELSTKEEGSVLNDALGKLLGLDVYESLIADLNIYTDGLRKESATAQVRQQIISTEKGIELNIEKIDDLDKEIILQEAKITRNKEEIKKYETFLITHSSSGTDTINLDSLYRQRDALKQKEKNVEIAFNELCELMPFAIAAGKLEEVQLHLGAQADESKAAEQKKELSEKATVLIERLFNNPPFPADGDISFAKKIFYAEKTKAIVNELFELNEQDNAHAFEHDLNKSDKELIAETYNYLRKQSDHSFQATIDNFNGIKNETDEIEKLIRKIETDQQDEEIIEYSSGKTESERKLEKLVEEKGSLLNQRDNLKKENDRLNQSLQILLKKISVSEQKKKKLDKANLYIKSLEDFAGEQKKNKCEQLEKVTYHEMSLLMNKLKDGSNGNFIAAVKAETLPENDGLKISLYDNEGNITPKESLSMGEKQIYISSLIKAILSLAMQDYPIFIDTPLGRLDHEHINNFLLNYYPNLSTQVVLMATNNEIPPSRYKLVKDIIAHAYILESNNNQTSFKPGYFQHYEN